ncbi:hypothetical protein [Tsukamurella sp. 1534]|uniref:hypothetical protein n=1 Tax=Tsukamurella sp. 1534 TaxID=1151061 RepID=UPI0002E56C78|nr:hypothetical protein [Tsukamurella sp. 1534]
MRRTISTIGKTITVGALAAGGLVAGGGAAHADGFPGGPWCNTDIVLKAESQLSQVVVCTQPGDTRYQYQGKAKTNGNYVTIPNAAYASGGYHAHNNGYAYHARPDGLEILGPDGAVVSFEPWISFVTY